MLCIRNMSRHTKRIIIVQGYVTSSSPLFYNLDVLLPQHTITLSIKSGTQQCNHTSWLAGLAVTSGRFISGSTRGISFSGPCYVWPLLGGSGRSQVNSFCPPDEGDRQRKPICSPWVGCQDVWNIIRERDVFLLVDHLIKRGRGGWLISTDKHFLISQRKCGFWEENQTNESKLYW